MVSICLKEQACHIRAFHLHIYPHTPYVLILVENWRNRELLLKERDRVVNLSRDRSTIDLNLHQMSLLLANRHLAKLGMRKNADDRAVLLHLSKFHINRLALLVLLPVLGILGEGLLLRRIPVLVEPRIEVQSYVSTHNRSEPTDGEPQWRDAAPTRCSEFGDHAEWRCSRRFRQQP